MVLSDAIIEDWEAKRLAQEEMDRIRHLEERDLELQDVELELENTKIDVRRLEALVEPARVTLKWMDTLKYPSGEASDKFVEMREALRAAIKPIEKASPWLYG